MRITIFGTGYVGLVTGTCLAEVGNDVVCVDVDADKVARLERGEIPIFEPGLEPLVRDNHAAGRLRFTTDAAAAIAHGRIVFIAVGTPPDEDGSADLSHVLAVARTIGEHLRTHAVVVNKSTVPVGTGDRVRATIAETLAGRGIDVPFDVVSNPEFLKEGDAVQDCLRPDRIVIGADSARAIEALRALYAPFNRNHERIVLMDLRSAELTKYAANAMLATKISFMNEMANIAERVGADIEQVRLGIGADPRIGYHVIYPGAGYGGSCFPKDVKALAHTAHAHGYDAHVLDAVEATNEAQKRKLFSLLEQLWAAGARVRAYDPEAADEVRRLYGERGDLVLCQAQYDALVCADALVVVTEWKAFRSPDFERVRAMLATPVVFDGRNIFDPRSVEAAGLAYYGIGRGRSIAVP